MITKLTEQKGCIIAEFIDLKRFTLAVTEEVKSELKPILSQEGNKMTIYYLHTTTTLGMGHMTTTMSTSTTMTPRG